MADKERFKIIAENLKSINMVTGTSEINLCDKKKTRIKENFCLFYYKNTLK